MAKCKKLTDRERGQIEALSSTGMSSRAIAIKIGRSKTVVNNFLKLKDNYGKKNTGGRPKALSSRDERRVCQLASTGKYSTRKLIPTTGLKVYQKTIYNTIRRYLEQEKEHEDSSNMLRLKTELLQEKVPRESIMTSGGLDN
ncbi:Transposable element Tc3 transposase like protein [Argiope bruennichi]|uniref:Transposable element Tc3 transposase like protein n=1 Tax=Argiope bruennichi TaxID=94029 RepID=A0A8T0FJ14_ARGBR|nr:Transposable element Tc3 transposase like protein [Argiope bruennichi]